MPSQGSADGAGGWPIVQSDTTADSTVSSEPSQESQAQGEESDESLLTLFWEAVKALL